MVTTEQRDLPISGPTPLAHPNVALRAVVEGRCVLLYTLHLNRSVHVLSATNTKNQLQAGILRLLPFLCLVCASLAWLPSDLFAALVVDLR